MSAADEPRMIRVPGPHVGTTWATAGLAPTIAVPSTPVGGAHLQLPVAAEGSFRLGCKDGSLGRLTLPARIAVDRRHRVYLLDAKAGLVLRCDPKLPGFDPEHPFQSLPGIGRNADSAAQPSAIAVDSNSLYLADAERLEVRVYSLEGFALCDVLTFASAYQLVDVVAGNGRVFILAADAVFMHRLGDNRPQEIQRADSQERWTRAALDRTGLLYLLEAKGSLQVYDPDRPGLKLDEVNEPATIRDRFPFPAIRSIPDESLDLPRYVMAESLARDCDRRPPIPAPNRTVEESLAGLSDIGFVFDSKGDRLETVRPAATRLYQTGARTLKAEDTGLSGVWISHALDSHIFRCRWDAAELEFASLPAGTAASIQTFTADDEQDVWQLPEEAWLDGITLTGANRDPAGDRVVRTEFLVDGPPGRYLWLRVRLRGDGYATPVFSKIEFRFPRRSYLEHLPAVFSQDEQSRRFLERFLAVFQAEWDRLEERVDDVAGLFDPASVPVSHLSYLAGWFGVRFENGTSAESRRRVLERLPGLAFSPRRDGDERPGGPRRGTASGLRDHLAAVLTELASDAELDTQGFPLIIEGFRERDYRMLATGGEPLHDGPTPRLFGPEQIGRFQLGTTSHLGESKLLPAERPDLDLFESHAHRFRVVVPESWVRSPAAEAALRRVLDDEKPAQTAYELDLVGPRFRIGVQSTVGVDTILAGPETLRLGHPAANPVLDRSDDREPGRAGPIRLSPETRLGTDAARL